MYILNVHNMNIVPENPQESPTKYTYLSKPCNVMNWNLKKKNKNTKNPQQNKTKTNKKSPTPWGYSNVREGKVLSYTFHPQLLIAIPRTPFANPIAYHPPAK